MSKTTRPIYVVDDDPSVRSGLTSLLRSVGYKVKSFTSATDISFEEPTQWPSCLLLDVQTPEPRGIDMHAELVQRGIAIPTIFITEHATVPMCVRAMKAGAIDFLLKPLSEPELLDAVRAAVETVKRPLRGLTPVKDIRARYRTLSRRESEVMDLVVNGRLNKQIAAELGLSEITIKVNRSSVMRKMHAETLACLVRMAERAALIGEPYA